MLTRKTPMKRTRMKVKRKPKPTAAELDRMGRVKAGGCLACWLNFKAPIDRAVRVHALPACECHHLLDGGKRLGHAFTVGLCPWHHRGVKPEYMESFHVDTVTAMLGPSHANGSKLFHEHYGPDSFLLELQERVLELLT